MVNPDSDDSTIESFFLDFPASLTAIVHPEESGGFSAEVPALPGCFTEGETLDELQVNLREAAEGWLKAHHDLVSVSLEGGASRAEAKP